MADKWERIWAPVHCGEWEMRVDCEDDLSDRGIVVALRDDGEITVGIYPSYLAGGTVKKLEIKELPKQPGAQRVVLARLPSRDQE